MGCNANVHHEWLGRGIAQEGNPSSSRDRSLNIAADARRPVEQSTALPASSPDDDSSASLRTSPPPAPREQIDMSAWLAKWRAGDLLQPAVLPHRSGVDL